MTTLKRVALLRAGGTPSVDDASMWSDSDEDGIAWVSIGDMSDGKPVSTTARRVSVRGVESKRLPIGEPGTLLFAMYASVGAVGRLATRATWNQALLGIAPLPGLSDERFIRYWLEHLRPSLGGLTRSNTQDNLNAEQVGNFPFPDMPLTEQRAIADYLDAETARIDALIAKKQQLIRLLEERRVGLALDAIRGGSVAGPRAASGLPWLGTIPANWEMPPVHARYDVLLGRMLNAERSTGGDQRPYLRNINVRWLDVKLDDVATMDFPENERSRYLLQPGDLLICEGGAGYARAAVWDGRVPEMYFQKSLHRVRPRGPWPVRWLAEFLRAGKAAGAFEAGGNLATIPHLTAEQLRVLRVPMPPSASEAQSILDGVDRQAERLLQTSASVHHQLALLAEHRQALITAAVTGEFAVPGAA